MGGQLQGILVQLSGGLTLGSDIPALLMAVPAFLAAWIGIGASKASLRYASLTAVAGLAASLVLSVSAIAYYLAQSAGRGIGCRIPPVRIVSVDIFAVDPAWFVLNVVSIALVKGVPFRDVLDQAWYLLDSSSERSLRRPPSDWSEAMKFFLDPNESAADTVVTYESGQSSPLRVVYGSTVWALSPRTSGASGSESRSISSTPPGSTEGGTAQAAHDTRS